jgi:OOP family OmpA-OmpF porin
MKKTILMACIASSISAVSIADEYPDFEAFIGAGTYMFENDRNLDDAYSLEGGLELPLNETMSLEAWLSDYTVDIDNTNAELDAQRIALGALFHLKEGSTRPFIAAGMGHLEFETESGYDFSETLVHLGLGVKKYFDNNIVLRGELMAMNSIDNEMTDLGARLAIGYAFGRSVSAPVVEEAPVEEVVVQEEPVQQTVQEEPVPAPAPAPVKPTPAPVDSDKDGIVDAQDKCPGTDVAYKVDATGCPVMLSQTVEIKMNVKFPNNSSIVSRDNFAEIQKVADFMKQFDGTSVTVEGHSDSTGSDEYNKMLSQRRADSVKNILIKEFNIAADRVNAIGYGEERPVADNNTVEGRAANRRVVGVVEATVKKAATK